MNESKKFKYYRRGQIIQVKFEPQTGYEIKGIHYAIVITKRDQPYIGTLTVVPLTSKSGNHLTPIGSCISDSVFLELLREKNYYYDLLLKAKIQTERIQKAGSVLEATTQDELNQIERDLKAYLDNIKYFDDLENKYKNIKKSSYANIYQITTIDKSKIVNPMNHLDPIKRIKAPDSVMDKIDKGIIEAFTQVKEKQ
jgi:mRNA-degrading endonuclease toxin of MazEF toxin-antitoxin module